MREKLAELVEFLNRHKYGYITIYANGNVSVANSKGYIEITGADTSGSPVIEFNNVENFMKWREGVEKTSWIGRIVRSRILKKYSEKVEIIGKVYDVDENYAHINVFLENCNKVEYQVRIGFMNCEVLYEG